MTKKIQPTPGEANKLALYVDSNRSSTLTIKVKAFCSMANDKVIPLMEDYGLPIDPKKVRVYCRNLQALKDDIIASEQAKYSKPGDPYYSQYIAKHVADELEATTFLDHAAIVDAKKLPIEAEAPQFSTFRESDNTYIVDAKAIAEHCTVYAEGKEAESWAKLKEAARMINEAFGCNVPSFPPFAGLWLFKQGMVAPNPEFKLGYYLIGDASNHAE